MQFLQWVLISLLCTACTLQPQMIMDEQNEHANEVANTVESEGNIIEIEGVLKETFVQGKDNQWYVYHDVNGVATTAGPNFMDYRCTMESDNLIVYGHSSRTSQILFTPLMQYLDEDFARSHDEIVLRLEDEIRVYELFSVFLFDVNQPSENDWMQTDFQKDFLFQQAVSRLSLRSLHKFDLNPTQQLLTLVTCNTQNHDERLIVMATRKSQ